MSMLYDRPSLNLSPKKFDWSYYRFPIAWTNLPNLQRKLRSARMLVQKIDGNRTTSNLILTPFLGVDLSRFWSTLDRQCVSIYGNVILLSQ